MLKYSGVVVAALLLCSCAYHTPATSFDSSHSVAYNTAHAIGLDVADASVPSTGASAVINPTAGAAAGYAVGGAVMGGAGFLSGIDTSPKTSVHVFGWVPVSMAGSQAAAQQIVETTFLTALAAEVGNGFAEVQVHGDILAIRKPGCGNDDRSCRSTMGTRTLDLVADKPVAPTFVPASELVWGPVGRRIVTTLSNDTIALASHRDLALRVSSRLPPWMFLYLPVSRQGPSVVLQAGKALYFGTK